MSPTIRQPPGRAGKPLLRRQMKELSAQAMALSILIVNWNTRQHLLECLESIFANPTPAEFEVVVVDNASGDDSAEAVAGLQVGR